MIISEASEEVKLQAMKEFSTYFKVKTAEQDPQNLLQVLRGVLVKSRVSMSEMTIAVPADYF